MKQFRNLLSLSILQLAIGISAFPSIGFADITNKTPAINEQSEESEKGLFDFLRGKRGKRGDQGDRGKRGPQGMPGADGIQGPQGPQGAQGPVGATGATGPAGLSPSPNIVYGLATGTNTNSVELAFSQTGSSFSIPAKEIYGVNYNPATATYTILEDGLYELDFSFFLSGLTASFSTSPLLGGTGRADTFYHRFLVDNNPVAGSLTPISKSIGDGDTSFFFVTKTRILQLSQGQQVSFEKFALNGGYSLSSAKGSFSIKKIG